MTISFSGNKKRFVCKDIQRQKTFANLKFEQVTNFHPQFLIGQNVWRAFPGPFSGRLHIGLQPDVQRVTRIATLPEVLLRTDSVQDLIEIVDFSPNYPVS